MKYKTTSTDYTTERIGYPKSGGNLPYVTKGIEKDWYSKCPLIDWIEEAYNSR